MPRSPPTLLTLPLELRLEIYTHLLVLPPPPPPETQQVIHRCSHAYSPPRQQQQQQQQRHHHEGPINNPSNNKSNNDANHPPRLHPQILAVSTQTRHEATPLLYTKNTFAAHPLHLTARAAVLRLPPRPHRRLTRDRHPAQLARIRRWHVRVRLDGPPPAWDRDRAGVAAAFSGAEELTIEAWRGAGGPLASSSSPGEGGDGDGVGVLRAFEGVRGVRRVRVEDGGGEALKGLERYVEWLVGRMMRSEMVGMIGCGKEGEGYVPVDGAEGNTLEGRA